MLVEIKATGICHTDEFTLSGADPEGPRSGLKSDIGTGPQSAPCEPRNGQLDGGDIAAPDSRFEPLPSDATIRCCSTFERRIGIDMAVEVSTGSGCPRGGRDRRQLGAQMTALQTFRGIEGADDGHQNCPARGAGRTSGTSRPSARLPHRSVA